MKNPERVAGCGNLNPPFHVVEVLRQDAFMPYREIICPGRHIRNRDQAFGIGYTVERCLEGDHDRAHLGMNVAEDVTDAYAIEDNGSLDDGFIKLQVKSLALKQV